MSEKTYTLPNMSECEWTVNGLGDSELWVGGVQVIYVKSFGYWTAKHGGDGLEKDMETAKICAHAAEFARLHPLGEDWTP